MKQLILLVIAIIFLLPLSKAQSGISVASFKELPMDMTARVTSPVIDQNGDVSALIRVVTTQTGFKWEAGMLSIVKAEHKTGEYWLYVPYGSKKLTIMHPKLGVLRNYFYPVPINKATVYEMVLTTGTVETIVHEAEIQTQYLIFKSEPAQADVYIDDTVYIGQTPLDKEFPLGTYTYRISKNLYQPEAGKIVLDEADGRKEINALLKPDFGSISVSSLPESGAEVFLNDKATGKYTPCTLEEVPGGTHTISLRKQWYIPKKEAVQLTSGQNLEIQIQMKEAFANISISTENEADIYINDQYKAKTNWNGRLEPGLYTIEARKNKHRTDSRKIQVISGEPQSLQLNPMPITGDLKIASDPFDAIVLINGEKKGKTPLTLRNLLIGEYTLEMKKNGYGTLRQSILVTKNEITFIDKDLPKGIEVNIYSDPMSAIAFIDNEQIGSTPLKTILSFGEHIIKLEAKNKENITKIIRIEDNTNNTFTFTIEGEQTDWQRISNSKNIPQLEEYASKYPNSRFIKQLNERILYYKAKKKYDASLYKRYVQEYPSGEFITEASFFLESYYIKNADQATSKHTSKYYYEQYLKLFPDGSKSKYAKYKIKKINNIEKKEEKKAVAKARRIKKTGGGFLAYSYDKFSRFGLTYGLLKTSDIGWYAKIKTNYFWTDFFAWTEKDYNYNTDYTGKHVNWNFYFSTGITFKLFYPLWVYLGGGGGYEMEIYEYEYGYDNIVNTSYTKSPRPESYGWHSLIDSGVLLKIGNKIVFKYGIIYGDYNYYQPLHQFGAGIML